MSKAPTPAEVRKARKAELAAWCTELGLDAEGKVDDLRARLLAHLKSTAKDAAKPPERPAPKKAPKPEPAEVPKEIEKEPEAEEEPEEEEEAEREEKPKARKAKKEKEAFTPKAKPKLEPSLRDLLRVRAQIAGRRPAFHRQEWFRHPRLTDAWRKPQGMQSKLRRHFGYRPNVVSIGYRGPKLVRGLHPSGFREVLVHTVHELEPIDPAVEAARIAGTVGARRRLEIQAAADEKGIRVLNRREEE